MRPESAWTVTLTPGPLVRGSPSSNMEVEGVPPSPVVGGREQLVQDRLAEGGYAMQSLKAEVVEEFDERAPWRSKTVTYVPLCRSDAHWSKMALDQRYGIREPEDPLSDPEPPRLPMDAVVLSHQELDRVPQDGSEHLLIHSLVAAWGGLEFHLLRAWDGWRRQNGVPGERSSSDSGTLSVPVAVDVDQGGGVE
jgi:hypothetical protein